jgi:hypothetical protein
MAKVPPQPKIFHITHLKNLPQIVEAGCLWSDAERIGRQLECKIVGMSAIKRRRIEELEVSVWPGTTVGQYVPFYFCPRSIMLYILHKGNHPELTYNEGQKPIVHLQADLLETIDWARRENVRWSFSNSNAGSRYCSFFSSIKQLDEIDWEAVNADDFRQATIKDGKQAEFLVFERFPWQLVKMIGAADQVGCDKIKAIVSGATYQPSVEVKSGWYF